MLYFQSGSEFTLAPPPTTTATASLHPLLSSWCLQTSSPRLPGFWWGLASGRHQQEFAVQKEREIYEYFFPTARSCCFSTSLLINTYVFMENSLWTDNRRGKICSFGLKMAVEEMLAADRSKGCCCSCWMAQVVACMSSSPSPTPNAHVSLTFSALVSGLGSWALLSFPS